MQLRYSDVIRFWGGPAHGKHIPRTDSPPMEYQYPVPATQPLSWAMRGAPSTEGRAERTVTYRLAKTLYQATAAYWYVGGCDAEQSKLELVAAITNEGVWRVEYEHAQMLSKVWTSLAQLLGEQARMARLASDIDRATTLQARRDKAMQDALDAQPRIARLWYALVGVGAIKP